MEARVLIRPATPADAEVMAPLVNQAGEGLPLYFWTKLVGPGHTPLDHGIARIRSEDAGISYRNGWIAELDGVAAGCLVAYRQPDTSEPIAPDEVPIFVPLAELENVATGTGYIFIVSTAPEFQGRGVGARLLAFAERYSGPNGMSLIVSSANSGARRLYERSGYREVQRRMMVKEGWKNPGTEWVLMIKPSG